jgi:hypothetical protein
VTIAIQQEVLKPKIKQRSHWRSSVLTVSIAH